LAAFSALGEDCGSQRGRRSSFDRRRPQLFIASTTRLLALQGLCPIVPGRLSAVSDNYARDWVAGAWRKLEFEYIRSSRPKGAIYLESLPVFTRGLARLPNHARLIRELRLLERRTHRSGKDTVEHPRNGHDDHANVVCGVLSLLAPSAFEQPNENAANFFRWAANAPFEQGAVGDLR
jgi:hypothetical protein